MTTLVRVCKVVPEWSELDNAGIGGSRIDSEATGIAYKAIGGVKL